MTELKYFISKYFTFFKASDLLCIGIPGTDQYLEVAYSEEVQALFGQLLTIGLPVESATHSELVGKLKEKNMINMQSPSEVVSRKELFFEYLLDIKGGELEKAYGKPLLILGAGAGGSTLCYLLAQLGFRDITIVDGDTVSGSDCEKTMVFRKQDIGKHKTTALREILRENFSVEINSIGQTVSSGGELEELLRKMQPALVIKACDPDLWFRAALNEHCFRLKLPYISIAYAYESINVGPLYVPGETSCDKGFQEAYVKTFGEKHDFRHVKRLFSGIAVHPSISFNINILASFALKEILLFLTGRQHLCMTYSRLLRFDIFKMKPTLYSATCKPDCGCKKIENL